MSTLYVSAEELDYVLSEATEALGEEFTLLMPSCVSEEKFPETDLSEYKKRSSEFVLELVRRGILVPGENDQYTFSDEILKDLRILLGSRGAIGLYVRDTAGRQSGRPEYLIAYLYKCFQEDAYLLLSEDDLRKDTIRMQQMTEDELLELLRLWTDSKAAFSMRFFVMPGENGGNPSSGTEEKETSFWIHEIKKPLDENAVAAWIHTTNGEKSVSG